MVKVVVVDDEPQALERYAAYVDEYGEPFQVVARCSSSREVPEIVAREKPQLLLTDIRMPGEDGLGLVERLRAAGWRGAAVFISGYDDFAYARQALRLRSFDYLLKPVFAQDMRGLLDRFLAERERAPEPTAACGEMVAVKEGAENDRVPVHIARAIDFLKDNYERRFSLAEAADYARVSVAHLCDSFSARYGVSVMEYARRYRMEAAKVLLSDPELPLKEIALRSGCGDCACFSKLFRKVVGCTPGAYRRSLRGGGG